MTDPLYDPRYQMEPAFRAQYLCQRAKEMERQAEELRKEAARFREIARRINPTT